MWIKDKQARLEDVGKRLDEAKEATEKNLGMGKEAMEEKVEEMKKTAKEELEEIKEKAAKDNGSAARVILIKKSLKSVSKMQQLDSMPNLKFQTFLNKDHPTA